MMFYLLFWRKCFVKRSSSFSRWMALFLQNKQKQGIYFSAWTIQRQDQYQCFTSIRLLTPPALRKHKCRFLEGVCGSRCSPSVVDARGQQAAARARAAFQQVERTPNYSWGCFQVPEPPTAGSSSSANTYHWHHQYCTGWLKRAQLLSCSAWGGAQGRCHPQVTNRRLNSGEMPVSLTKEIQR